MDQQRGSAIPKVAAFRMPRTLLDMKKPRTGGTPRLLRFLLGGTDDGEGLTRHNANLVTHGAENASMKVGLTALAKAGVELGENGSIIPRLEGEASSPVSTLLSTGIQKRQNPLVNQ